jgi:hypothetical protein
MHARRLDDIVFVLVTYVLDAIDLCHAPHGREMSES